VWCAVSTWLKDKHGDPWRDTLHWIMIEMAMDSRNRGINENGNAEITIDAQRKTVAMF
jgi:hypothetical protein